MSEKRVDGSGMGAEEVGEWMSDEEEGEEGEEDRTDAWRSVRPKGQSDNQRGCVLIGTPYTDKELRRYLVSKQTSFADQLILLGVIGLEMGHRGHRIRYQLGAENSSVERSTTAESALPGMTLYTSF